MRNQVVFVGLLLLASCGGSANSSSQPADAACVSPNGPPPGLGGARTDAANDVVVPSEPDALADASAVPAADAVSSLDAGVLEASVEAGDASENSLEPNPSCSGIAATFVTGTERCWMDSKGSAEPVCVSNDYGYTYSSSGFSVEPQIVLCFPALASGCPSLSDWGLPRTFPKYTGNSRWCAVSYPSTQPSVCTGTGVPSGSSMAYGLLEVSWDEDQDLITDVEDDCVHVSNFFQVDTDQDGVGDACDNCPYAFNPDQQTGSTPGIGAACDCSASPQPALGPNGCPCPADGGFAVDIDGGSARGVVLDCTGHVVDAGAP